MTKNSKIDALRQLRWWLLELWWRWRYWRQQRHR
jgi:hypothetical protein